MVRERLSQLNTKECIMNKLIKMGLTCLATSLLVMTSLPTLAAKDYSSAEIYTADTWLYGKYVFRMQAAEGSGVLSNFFLWKPDSETSAVDWQEVDFEVFGKNGANSWQSKLITAENGWQTSEQLHAIASSFADEYHTFTLEWTPTYIAWSVDGVEVRRTSSGQAEYTNSAASLRFNLWASTSAEWVGDFDYSILPVHMYVNWLQYYSWNGETFDLEWHDDFDTFDTNRWSEADWTFDGNYVDFVPENSTVSDGYLVLSLTKSGEEGFTGTVSYDIEDPEDPMAPKEPEEPLCIIPAQLLRCTYTIINEWDTGFFAEISVANDRYYGVETENWSVTWFYGHDSDTTVTQLWNAELSEDTSYTTTYAASSLSWNAAIASDQTVVFGFIGKKGSGDAEIPSISCTTNHSQYPYFY